MGEFLECLQAGPLYGTTVRLTEKAPTMRPNSLSEASKASGAHACVQAELRKQSRLSIGVTARRRVL